MDTARPAQLGVLGPLEVRGPDRAVVEIPKGRRRMLLAVLAAQRGLVVPADRLFEAVWGEAAGDHASSLHSSVSRLRRALPPNFELVTHPAGYRLDLAGADVDADRFEAALDRARAAAGPDEALAQIELALGLWRGRAFDGVEDRPGVEGVAARLEELRVAAREERVALLVAAGRSLDAVAGAEELVRELPTSDRCCELLMLALYHRGRHADALAAYRRHLDGLAEAGLEPTARLSELEGQVLRHEVPDLRPPAPTRPPTAAPIAAPAAPPGEPPTAAPTAAEGSTPPRPTGRPHAAPPLPLSSFVGREVDLDAVLRLVRRSRLVTLVGPGGVGKTRLALHLADAMAAEFPDGVWYAELAPVLDADAVPSAIATALGIEQRAGLGPTERVIDALRPRRALVVLDNCEHVLDAAAAFCEQLLLATREVRVLATSREALVVDGEHRWPVRPLALPTGDAADDVAALAAVELFRDRAAAVLGSFEPTPDEARLVQVICRRVDGLPLGIELAAARIGSLGLQGVAQGLDRPLELLNRGRRTATARHRSLREVVAWSHRLLDAPERLVFDTASVFAGDFTAESAAVVAGPGLQGRGAAEVADLLGDLVERSLLVRRASPDGPRYALLETLRAFGQEQLAERGELGPARDRHARHVVELAERGDRGVRSAAEAEWVRRLDADLTQFRAAHQHLLATGDADGYLRLSVALQAYGWMRFRTEVGDWAAEGAARGVDVDGRLLPYVLGAAALSTCQRGDLERGEELARSAVALGDGDHPSTRVAWEAVGDARLLKRDMPGARDAYAASHDACAAAGDAFQHTIAIVNQSLCAAFDGRPEEAASLATRALQVAEGLAMPSGLAWAHFAVGVSLLEADPTAAFAELDEATALARAVDAALLVGAIGLTAARAHAARGEDEASVALFEQLVDHFARSGAWMQQWTTLRNLVVLLSRCAEHEVAVQLAAAATTSGMATPSQSADAQLQAALARARDELGEARAERLYAAGASLEQYDAIQLAQATMARVRRALGPPAPSPALG